MFGCRCLELNSTLIKHLEQSVVLKYYHSLTISGEALVMTGEYCMTDGLNNKLLVWYSSHDLNKGLSSGIQIVNKLKPVIQIVVIQIVVIKNPTVYFCFNFSRNVTS